MKKKNNINTTVICIIGFTTNNLKNLINIPDNYIFVENLDQVGNDIYYKNISLDKCFEISNADDTCVGFNSLGYFKDNILNLTCPDCFKEGDGIYIKKDYYNKHLL